MAEPFMFVAGGAVQAGGGIYLERDADRELLQHCLAGDFTYILTSRQMGKSSLMYRAAEHLARTGARPIIIDLTELGAQTTADQWYKGFLLLVQEQLGLRTSAAEWWDANAGYGFAHRLIRYLREVALVERSERLVLFVDEIDTTLRLDFTDDFFAAIRFLYQNRAVDPELDRISFVLIGVATPNDLIKDAARTPFNIGHRIELTDFTRQEVAAIGGYLALPPDVRTELVEKILHWAGGHPYLTMRVFRSLVESPPQSWNAAAIDARMYGLFLGTSGESDTNLQFVRDMLTKKAFDREAVLATYQRIRSGARLPDRELDQVASWLKLSGIVRRHGGLLRVRNTIYEHVFDERWARVHRQLNVNWRRRFARASAALLVIIVLVTIPLAVFAFRQKAIAEDARSLAETERQEALRQRDETVKQLLVTQRNLQTADEAVAALKTFDPKAAAQLSTELATAGKAADREIRALTEEREKLRNERDAALAAVQRLNQENAALRQSQLRSSPPAASSLSQRPVPIPLVPDTGETSQRTSDDGLQIVRLLQRYRAGYEALDARAIAAVYPSTDVASLQRAMSQLSKLGYDLKIHVDGIVIAADGQTASVTASETFRPTPKIGRASPQSGAAVFTMRKAAGGWTIQNIKSDARSRTPD